MKKSLMVLWIGVLFTSCVIKEDDSLGFASWVPFAVGAFIVFFILLVVSSDKETKSNQESLARRGLSYNDFKNIGKYVGGHPRADREILNVVVKDELDSLSFYSQEFSNSIPCHRFDIKKKDIKGITIEDASSIEKKVTLGRVLLVGVFALAWRKNKNKEVAFLVIEWEDGRFDHSTVFVNEGNQAMFKANAARNHLIKLIEE